MLSWSCYLKEYTARARRRVSREIIKGKVGASQAFLHSSALCKTCLLYQSNEVSYLDDWKWRALTQRPVKLREAACTKALKSGPPVKACSPFSPLCLEVSTPELESICTQNQNLWNLNPWIKGKGPNCFLLWGRSRDNLVLYQLSWVVQMDTIKAEQRK